MTWRVRCVVRGVVQGVFFRASAMEEAQRLGLAGWVRNAADGSVELVAEGPQAPLEELVAWLGKGPPGARVERVETTYAPGAEGHVGFRITR